MFNYEILNQESTTIVSFEGDMDIDVTEVMNEEISPKLMECQELDIDFSGVQFVDSSGIGLLITFINNLQDNGCKVMVKNLNPDVKEVFSLLQLPDILGQDVFADFAV